MLIASNLNATPHRNRRLDRALSALLGSLLAATALAGCAGNAPENFGVGQTTGATVRATGSVWGGQQPVSGATIQLLTVGTTGVGSTSTNILNTGVTTDQNGNFALTGKYTCGSATQVYLLATGGDPGSGANSAISLSAALGSCANLLANAATTFITVNEVTTVAAAYALAPFAPTTTSGSASVGATGSNPVGLVNAFANAALLANTATGTAGGAGLATGVTVPVAEINTLADILASCVNSSSPGSGACSMLLGVTNRTDTFAAMIAVAQRPGTNTYTNLYALAGSSGPFQPTLSSQPGDFSVAVTFAGTNNLATPYAIAIDASGNAWVVNESGNNVSQFSPAGALLADVKPTGLYGAQAIAIDTNGRIYVANTPGNAVVSISPTAPYPSSNIVNSVFAPTGLAVDQLNQLWVANFNPGSVSVYSNSGTTVVYNAIGAGTLSRPTAIAIDNGGFPWVANSDGSTVRLNPYGGIEAVLSDNALQGPVSIATENGYTVMAGFTTGTAIAGGLTQYFVGDSVVTANPVATNLTTPGGIAISSKMTALNSLTFVANNTATGGLSIYRTYPLASYENRIGAMSYPVGVAIDGSGSVWTANTGSNTVSKFIGVSYPTLTPIAANLGN